MYVLDALDAYNKRLVKRIEVKGFDIKNLRGTDSYLYLERIVISPRKPPMARLEFEIAYQKSINRETRQVGVDDDLYALSKGMEQYRGYHVSAIDPIRGEVSFTNGVTIHAGEVTGDVSEADMRRVEIRETIRSHFEKEKALFDRGVKCLSLFFIDEVAKYRKYDEDGNETNSEYGDIFEQEYTDILNEYLTLFDTPYERYLRSIDVHSTHAGYFSIDKKGRKVDSKLKRGSDESDDTSAYDLILKDKERLLSFDNPCASSSALGPEGRMGQPERLPDLHAQARRQLADAEAAGGRTGTQALREPEWRPDGYGHAGRRGAAGQPTDRHRKRRLQRTSLPTFSAAYARTSMTARPRRPRITSLERPSFWTVSRKRSATGRRTTSTATSSRTTTSTTMTTSRPVPDGPLRTTHSPRFPIAAGDCGRRARADPKRVR